MVLTGGFEFDIDVENRSGITLEEVEELIPAYTVKERADLEKKIREIVTKLLQADPPPKYRRDPEELSLDRGEPRVTRDDFFVPEIEIPSSDKP